MPDSPWVCPSDGVAYKFNAPLLKQILRDAASKIDTIKPAAAATLDAVAVLTTAVLYNDRGVYLDREELEKGAKAAVKAMKATVLDGKEEKAQPQGGRRDDGVATAAKDRWEVVREQGVRDAATWGDGGR